MYWVHQESCANQGQTPGFGESPSDQPISGPVIFSKRQALSRAVVVDSNMSHGKYLAWEGPGSRLPPPPPPRERFTVQMQIDRGWASKKQFTALLNSFLNSAPPEQFPRALFFFYSLTHKPQGAGSWCRVRSDNIIDLDTKPWFIWLR